MMSVNFCLKPMIISTPIKLSQMASNNKFVGIGITLKVSPLIVLIAKSSAGL